MLTVNNVKLAFGKQVLFKEVNIKFTPGNCYGLIGANGSGKSTFLKVLSGELEPNEGSVSHGPSERIAVLRQDQYAFDAHSVLDTVIMGHERLRAVLREREEIYAKADFSDEDGMRAGELESLLGEMNGYEAESDAATLLDKLGVPDEFHGKLMKDIPGTLKVRVLLAQALFGNPDILLLDEPTNHLDIKTIRWLENFLMHFENTVIVVSHDRHFLNRVCTHIADIDFNQIRIYVGNYDFWKAASQLMMKQKKDANRKNEEKVKELEEFIRRFSANASKSRQATSRRKLIDKLTIEDIPASTRRFPYVVFKPERACGNVILTVENLTVSNKERCLVKDLTMNVQKSDKIAFVGDDATARTAFFQVLAGELKPDSGSALWGQTITPGYFPKDNSAFFSKEMNLIDWLRQYSADQTETFIRSFLGRMLFTGEETFKQCSVLSGGEKVRCMLARMMLAGANALVLDEPTNHLDLESISSLNDALVEFPEVVLFAAHDHQFIETIANRIIEFIPGGGVIDKRMGFEEYLDSEDVAALRDELYHEHHELTI